MSGWLYDVKSAGQKRMVISLLTLRSCPIHGKQQTAQTHCISILFITLMATSMSSPRMSLVLMIMMTATCPCCSHHQEPPTSRVLCSASPHRLSAVTVDTLDTAQLPGLGTVSTNPPLWRSHYQAPQSLTRISNKHSSLIQPANERGFDFIITQIQHHNTLITKEDITFPPRMGQFT